MHPIANLGAFLALLCIVDAKYSPPKVSVYSLDPGMFGKSNRLICQVTDFHPPDINIRLLRDGVEIPSEPSDLAFGKNWQFHLSYNAVFTPQSGEKYSCEVTHVNRANPFEWDPKM